MGQLAQIGGIKIFYTIVVGKRKRKKSILDMLERGAECEGANCESC
jgi:hypothetical protein